MITTHKIGGRERYLVQKLYQKIWAKIGSNLRKFEKNQVQKNCRNFAQNQADLYMNVSRFLGLLVYAGPLSKFTHPYQNQTWYPLGKLHRGKLGNGEHLISSKSGKEGTMKIVYSNYYSFTRLWCIVIWKIYLNFVVKFQKKKKKKKTGKWLCLLLCTCDFDWAVHENKK